MHTAWHVHGHRRVRTGPRGTYPAQVDHAAPSHPVSPDDAVPLGGGPETDDPTIDDPAITAPLDSIPATAQLPRTVNDPCFELGNVWSEARLPRELLDVLIAAYVGRERPDQVALARLFALMSQYGWALWASIMDGSSSLDFDFWEWGMQKYERAVATFDGPEFESMLDAAAAGEDRP